MSIMVLRGSKTKSDNVVHLCMGGAAGCVSRTVVAPLDRVKILMQTQGGTQHWSRVLRSTFKKEGTRALWKGNALNCLRIFPFSGIQFAMYDFCKTFYAHNATDVAIRLKCGIAAGIVSTTATHPIDVIRHRLLCYADVYTWRGAALDLYRERGLRSYWKGYGSTVCSLTPFIACNFCIFDWTKDVTGITSTVGVLGLGAWSALAAQCICYPMDTIRRRMQLRGNVHAHGLDAARFILRHDGVRAFYRGMVPNALKIVPNNAIRFAMYDIFSSLVNL